MKLQKFSLGVVALFILAFSAAPAHAQFGGLANKAKNKAKEAAPKSSPTAPAAPADKAKPAVPQADDDASGGENSESPSNTTGGEEWEQNRANAVRLAKAPGMPKAANTDAALNKMLMEVAIEHRLIPRRVVVTDANWFEMTDVARNNKMRRIFAVIGRTKDDGSGNCAKQMVQFDSNWRESKKAWDRPYVQNIGEIVPIACGAIGK